MLKTYQLLIILHLTITCAFEISHTRRIYTMEMDKHYKSGLFWFFNCLDLQKWWMIVTDEACQYDSYIYSSCIVNSTKGWENILLNFKNYHLIQQSNILINEQIFRTHSFIFVFVINVHKNHLKFMIKLLIC
jgi:hypothetical protein